MGVMNELINRATVGALRSHLATAAPDIEWTALQGASGHLDGLSLRARSDLVSAALLEDLPAGYRRAAAIFRRALAAQGFTGWMIWPVTETVATLALAEPGSANAPGAPFDDGLALLAELTPRLTGEFAIRRFLEADLHRALRVIRHWTSDPDEHVRRLASEGTRAFLPWAVRVRAILARPDATVPIIDALRGDPSEYVRRSVANHLNDLAREQPDLAVAVAARWMTTPDANTAWVVRHGLRTLVKKADPGALALMGFDPVVLTVTVPRLDSGTVSLPGELGFAFEITNGTDAATRLAVDYVISYLKSNGSHSDKVFKLAVTTLDPGATLVFRKRHAFRQMTTRVHYPGAHALELQVNGRRYPGRIFEVVD